MRTTSAKSAAPLEVRRSENSVYLFKHAAPNRIDGLRSIEISSSLGSKRSASEPLSDDVTT